MNTLIISDFHISSKELATLIQPCTDLLNVDLRNGILDMGHKALPLANIHYLKLGLQVTCMNNIEVLNMFPHLANVEIYDLMVARTSWDEISINTCKYFTSRVVLDDLKRLLIALPSLLHLDAVVWRTSRVPDDEIDVVIKN